MITAMPLVEHPQLPGVKIFPLEEDPAKNKPQQVLVICGVHVQIPLHRHRHNASMFIVSGSGRLLSADPVFNGMEVITGDQVFFQGGQYHGFQAGKSGLRFISTNGGIVDIDPENWDLELG